MHNIAWILSTGQNGLLASWIYSLPTSFQIHSPSPLNDGVPPAFKTHLEVTSSRKFSLTAPVLPVLSLPHPTGLLWDLSVLLSRHSGQTLGIPTYLPKIGHISPKQPANQSSIFMSLVPSPEMAWRTGQTHYVTRGDCLNLLGPIFTRVLVNTNKMKTVKGPRTEKSGWQNYLF